MLNDNISSKEEFFEANELSHEVKNDMVYSNKTAKTVENELSLQKQVLMKCKEDLEKQKKILDDQEKELKHRENEVAKKADENDKLYDSLMSEAKENRKRAADISAQEKAIKIKMIRMSDEADEAKEKIEKEIDNIRESELEKIRIKIETYKKKKIDALNNDIELERAMRLEALKNEYSEKRQKEEKTLREELNKISEDIVAEKEQLKIEKDKLRASNVKLQEDYQKLEEERNKLSAQQQHMEFLQDNFEEKQELWEKELEKRFNGRDKEYAVNEKAINEQLLSLRLALQERENRLQKLESIKIVYGDVKAMENQISELYAANKRLENEMARRPLPEIAKECERYKKRVQELEEQLEKQSNRIGEAMSILAENEQLNRELNIAQENVAHLKNSLEARTNEVESLEAELDRLRAKNLKPADLNNRMASIKVPYMTNPLQAPSLRKDEVAEWDEMKWLDRIENLCNEYGVRFPRRILDAYHTSLKIANWSTITVLAGVSGTGKSELPRLYACFGGLNFINVPVQPNWDSQESMLGFFNSIDNKFDAQPMLRFLYQCSIDKEKNANGEMQEVDYPLNKTMAITLLDEMNLAHVEHYFADFLDKLELRRNSSEVPYIDVSLGAGAPSFKLPLSRNILYCGTMNQDETTKALSDKVLDRGIVIFFPRPRHLYNRDSAQQLSYFLKNKETVPPLSIDVWDSWREKKIPLQGKQREELEKYRKMLEEINMCLSEAGRAIGHRVWQSIAHYVVNHPRVREALHEAKDETLTPKLREAMHTAVEDQIVQKVMPKLRGIDTSGNSMKKCLKPIGTILSNYKFKLDSDFQRACEMGYGQFMWCSADYIEAEESEKQSSKE